MDKFLTCQSEKQNHCFVKSQERIPSSYLRFYRKCVVSDDPIFLRRSSLFAEKVEKQWKLENKDGEDKDESKRNTEIGALGPNHK